MIRVYIKFITYICGQIFENHPYACILHIKYSAVKSSLKFLFIYCSFVASMQ